MNKKFQDLLNMIEPNNRNRIKGNKRSWAINCCNLIEDFLKHLLDFRKFRPMKYFLENSFCCWIIPFWKSWITTSKWTYLIFRPHFFGQSCEYRAFNFIILSYVWVFISTWKQTVFLFQVSDSLYAMQWMSRSILSFNVAVNSILALDTN